MLHRARCKFLQRHGDSERRARRKANIGPDAAQTLLSHVAIGFPGLGNDYL